MVGSARHRSVRGFLSPQVPFPCARSLPAQVEPWKCRSQDRWCTGDRLVLSRGNRALVSEGSRRKSPPAGDTFLGPDAISSAPIAEGELGSFLPAQRGSCSILQVSSRPGQNKPTLGPDAALLLRVGHPGPRAAGEIESTPPMHSSHPAECSVYPAGPTAVAKINEKCRVCACPTDSGASPARSKAQGGPQPGVPFWRGWRQPQPQCPQLHLLGPGAVGGVPESRLQLRGVP